MKILIIVTFTVLSLLSSSQTYEPNKIYRVEYSQGIGKKMGDIIYFDEDWRETSVENHEFYRVFTISNYALNGEKLIKVTDYYKSGRLQMTAYVSNKDSLDFIGLRTYYKENGNIKSKDLIYYNKSIDAFPGIKDFASIIRPSIIDSITLIVNYRTSRSFAIGYCNNYRERIGQWIFLSSGGAFVTVEYKNDELNGIYKAHNSSNTLRKRGVYKNDLREGVWEYYSKKGKLEKEVFYRNDTIIMKTKH